MKTLQDMIKDLTGITVEQNKISKYLENEALDLQGAVLKEADLYRANLQGADLQGANLQWANLINANLRGASITKEQLEQLIIIEGD
ncbi:pentapeptide repeat-containing protein [Spiroplasma citri]|uniref:Pentapeptide repeat-containing protein n=1 Tax=Spiroplasma citri TaxID=2133 RepID=A0AAX3SY99_SPICI|nr:pentapeptide repeat-containing protein [Spiroplasma citri]WFG96250.1 pentapeptide repeat-containing protein [Spiroplasma citri]